MFQNCPVQVLRAIEPESLEGDKKFCCEQKRGKYIELTISWVCISGTIDPCKDGVCWYEQNSDFYRSFIMVMWWMQFANPRMFYLQRPSVQYRSYDRPPRPVNCEGSAWSIPIIIDVRWTHGESPSRPTVISLACYLNVHGSWVTFENIRNDWWLRLAPPSESSVTLHYDLAEYNADNSCIEEEPQYCQFVAEVHRARLCWSDKYWAWRQKPANDSFCRSPHTTS